MACRTGCPTQDHQSWGECARASRINVGWVQHLKGLDLGREKKWNRELDAYADARRQGVQPAGTKLAQVEKAMQISDKVGRAFDATRPLESVA